MFKKKLILGMLLASVSLGLAGCGESTEAPTEEEESVIIEESIVMAEEETKIEAETEGEAEIEEIAEQQGNLSEMLDLSVYESYGSAFGGVIPVKVNGLWGAVNYEGQEIVPCQYDEYYRAPNENGYFILDNYTIYEEVSTLGTTYEVKECTYFLFGPDGKVVYEGLDKIVASANFYAVLKIEYENPRVEYYDYDGNNFLTTNVYDQTVVDAFGAYNGTATIYRSEVAGAGLHDIQSEIGKLNEDNSVEWSSKYFYTNKQPISTVNHGYFVANNYAFNHGEMQLYSEDSELISEWDMGYVNVTEDGVKIDSGSYHEDFSIIGFLHDGEYIYNYGSKMVWRIGEKNMLVDLALCPGMTVDTMSEDIVTAIYDKIYMTEANYWRVCDGEQWGYIDHDGNEVAMYDAQVSNFIDGYALIMKDGKACLINESFEILQEYGEADEVGTLGEFLAVLIDGNAKILKWN